jgi:hypothetical protein
MNARCASRRRRGRGLRPFAGRLHGMPQSLVDGACGQIGKHHAIATAAAIDQNAVSRRVAHASHASPLSQLRGQRRVGALARPVFVAYSRGRLLPTSGRIYARRASARARPLPADRLASVPASSEMFAVTNRPIVRRCKGNRALTALGQDQKPGASGVQPGAGSALKQRRHWRIRRFEVPEDNGFIAECVRLLGLRIRQKTSC